MTYFPASDAVPITAFTQTNALGPKAGALQIIAPLPLAESLRRADMRHMGVALWDGDSFELSLANKAANPQNGRPIDLDMYRMMVEGLSGASAIAYRPWMHWNGRDDNPFGPALMYRRFTRVSGDAGRFECIDPDGLATTLGFNENARAVTMTEQCERGRRMSRAYTQVWQGEAPASRLAAKLGGSR